MEHRILSEGTEVGGYRVRGLLRKDHGIQTYAVSLGDAASSGPLTLTLVADGGTSDHDGLLQRAELLKRVRHRGVARVYDVGRYGDDLFVARQRVRGFDLGTLVERRGRLGVDASIEILSQVVEALAVLRGHGAVGGGLTVRNVFVDLDEPTPLVRLADVGLVPPETEPGAVTDERSDVYALGTMLFSGLVGARPGSRFGTVLRRQTPRLPGALDAVVAQALDADPGNRFATGDALLRAARRAVRDAPVRALPGTASGHEPPLDQPPTDAGKDPPDAYALLDADDTVLVGATLDVTVGLSPTPDPRARSHERLRRPPGSRGPYELTVTLEVQPDFEPAEGQPLTVTMDVTADDPHPFRVVQIVAKDVTRTWTATLISATYSTEDQTMGHATRPVGIAASTAFQGDATPTTEPEVSCVTVGPWGPPDLTIDVLPSVNPAIFYWSYRSPHALPQPDAGHKCDLGYRPEEFAREVIGEIPMKGAVDLPNYLRGAGRTIAEAVPAGFWPLLAAAASAARGPPTLLFNSRDPYVPWELALLDRPLDGGTKPAFLATQAIVGRWVPGQFHPPPAPPAGNLPARRMTVVSGRYDGPTLRRLTEAEEEAKDLVSTYRADPLQALRLEVMGCLDVPPTPDILHFAMHARGEVGGLRNGLVMIDSETLETGTISGTTLMPAPFVFLNACEAGTGQKLLGESAGVASAFLKGGAAAVVAPLWKISDRVARDVATRFYREVFDEGVQVADFLRKERVSGAQPDSADATTHLAYVFFGHPRMRLQGPAGGCR